MRRGTRRLIEAERRAPEGWQGDALTPLDWQWAARDERQNEANRIRKILNRIWVITRHWKQPEKAT